MSGRPFLVAGTVLLSATAAIHMAGQPMVEGWLEGLDEQQRAGLCLMWMAVAFDWIVTAVLWGLAAWWLCREWLITASVAAAIPLAVAMGVISIDPRFFGGWMLAGSVGLFAIGAVTEFRRQARHH
jgi:hypothetical protein